MSEKLNYTCTKCGTAFTWDQYSALWDKYLAAKRDCDVWQRRWRVLGQQLTAAAQREEALRVALADVLRGRYKSQARRLLTQVTPSPGKQK